MKRTFAIVPPGALATWLVPGLVSAALAGAALLAARNGREAWFVFPLMVVVAAIVLLALRRRRVELEDGVLRVVAGLNTARVPAAAIDLDRARIVSLDEHEALRPGIKTFGTALPGYRAGHFRRFDGARSFVLLTTQDRVLLLPERSGRRLLLSLEQPQALLDALRAVTAPPGRR